MDKVISEADLQARLDSDSGEMLELGAGQEVGTVFFAPEDLNTKKTPAKAVGSSFSKEFASPKPTIADQAFLYPETVRESEEVFTELLDMTNEKDRKEYAKIIAKTTGRAPTAALIKEETFTNPNNLDKILKLLSYRNYEFKIFLENHV